jgi:predicted DCC family thiol-disulfide oxidoreductase YuxK
MPPAPNHADRAQRRPPGRTNPPRGGRAVLLYDGACRFCVGGAARLRGLARRGAIELADYNQPGALEPFPGLTTEECRRAMHLVRPDGRVFRGVGAVAEAIATRGPLGRLARICHVPGLRHLLGGVYRVIAANRYRLMGRTAASPACDLGACGLHDRPCR